MRTPHSDDELFLLLSKAFVPLRRASSSPEAQASASEIAYVTHNIPMFLAARAGGSVAARSSISSLPATVEEFWTSFVVNPSLPLAYAWLDEMSESCFAPAAKTP